MRRVSGVILVTAVAAVVVSVGLAANPRVFGTTGPGFSITLRDASGQAVTRLEPGALELEVDDRSEEHNFHLIGPGGVDVFTGLETTGIRTFNVRLVDGRYTFQCDPHAASMRGIFDVGNVPPPPPPPPPPAPGVKPSAPVGSRLVLTVGPGLTISLKTTAGRRVTLLRPGRYTVVARDRSNLHNAHLLGAGSGRATGVGFVGTKTWKLGLRKGRLVVQCDPHSTAMRTSVRVA